MKSHPLLLLLLSPLFVILVAAWPLQVRGIISPAILQAKKRAKGTPAPSSKQEPRIEDYLDPIDANAPPPTWILVIPSKRGSVFTNTKWITRLPDGVNRIHESVSKFKSSDLRRDKIIANMVAKDLAIGSHEKGGAAMMMLTAKQRGFHLDWRALRDFYWDGGQTSELKFNSQE